MGVGVGTREEWPDGKMAEGRGASSSQASSSSSEGPAPAEVAASLARRLGGGNDLGPRPPPDVVHTLLSWLLPCPAVDEVRFWSHSWRQFGNAWALRDAKHPFHPFSPPKNISRPLKDVCGKREMRESVGLLRAVLGFLSTHTYFSIMCASCLGSFVRRHSPMTSEEAVILVSPSFVELFTRLATHRFQSFWDSGHLLSRDLW